MKFRTDINGLRAIAVIAVVLFHFNPSWVPGGFAGVDVFFVISGFLMTGLIFRGLENNNFSIINFYVARANRIIPALSVVCLVLLVFGWFWFPAEIYRELAYQVSSSLGFVSNFIYALQGGYFDGGANDKWLLHTWSLSVEWQFYMIYPVVLVLLKKCMSLTNIKRLLVVGTVVGFVFSIYGTFVSPKSAYLLLPTRAWEMMMGGLAFLYPLQNLKETSKKYLEWVGIALILASYAFISKDNMWPGYLALIPVLGAYLVIIANRSGSVITDNIVMQKVGLWSYSIYLWHWPISMMFKYLDLSGLNNITYGIILSVLFGYFSYKYVEKKIFIVKNGNIKRVLLSPVAYIYVLIAIYGVYIYKLNGFEERLPEDYRKIESNIKMPLVNNGYCFYSVDSIPYLKVGKGLNCHLGDKKSKNNILLFGDSYAGQYEPFWGRIAKEEKLNIQSITTNFCYPSLTDNFPKPQNSRSLKQCLINREYVLKNINKYDTIIVSGMVSANSKALSEMIDFIKFANKKGKKVIIMPVPKGYDYNFTRRFEVSWLSGLSDFNISKVPFLNDKNKEKANEILSDFAKKNPENIFINRSDIFKGDYFLVDGVNIPYSLDGGHISIAGSLQAAKNIKASNKYKMIIDKINNS